MAKTKSVYECTTCGDQHPKWVGRCTGCGHWSTLVETVPGVEADLSGTGRSVDSPVRGAPAQPAATLAEQEVLPVSTGLGELDRVLGGGLVAGSVTLIGGEPGVGKSTLLVQVAAARVAGGSRVLYVSAEESVHQVSARLERIGGRSSDGLWLGAEPTTGRILTDMRDLQPDLVVIDSIQTIYDPALASAPGSVSQVRHCAHELSRAAKDGGIALVLVGQVTKDGSLAGPRVLEHLVDTVVTFDGDRELGLRVLRAVKHRFGPTGELGVLEMTGRGMIEVGDPSSLLLADRRTEVAGSAISVSVEGRRALLVELQALVTKATGPAPRRAAQGLDQSRLSMLLAVLDRRAELRVTGLDVYSSVIGGIRITEPGVDLGLCCAVASSFTDTPINPQVVVVGEVGLAGEVRGVPWIDRRLTEAARLGFTRAIVPSGSLAVEPPLQTIPVATLSGALQALGLTGQPTSLRPDLELLPVGDRVAP